MQDHVLRALDERSPLAAPIPLPEHIRKAAVFTWVELAQLNPCYTGPLAWANHLVLTAPMAQWEFSWRPQLLGHRSGSPGSIPAGVFFRTWCVQDSLLSFPPVSYT